MKKIMIAVMTAMMAVGCNQGKNAETTPNIRQEMTISGLSDDKWTYFSIETGEVVGSSDFMSEKDDMEWAKRKDWDFAICGEYIKTNGGTSGEGNGGVLRDKSSNFITLKEAPAEGYLQDSYNTVD